MADACRHGRRVHGVLAGAFALGLAGCSVLSVNPTLELVKGVGAAANSALSMASPSAQDTVYHPHAPVKQICIEVNRDSPAADLVPALQAELQARRVDSRVYELRDLTAPCDAWLAYNAAIEWELPPLGSEYHANLVAATLTLRRPDGEVLATSSYGASDMGLGHWAPTRRKLAPLVAAVLTGAGQ